MEMGTEGVPIPATLLGPHWAADRAFYRRPPAAGQRGSLPQRLCPAAAPHSRLALAVYTASHSQCPSWLEGGLPRAPFFFGPPTSPVQGGGSKGEGSGGPV